MKFKKIGSYALIVLGTTLVTAALLTLLFNIRERKHEAEVRWVPVVSLTEEDVDAKKWGLNFPREYDSYLKTVDTERTKYGGSEAFSKLDEDPDWKRIFDGYAFGVEYREERGHAYSLADQKETLRTRNFAQPGACLHCHAGGMKNVYEKAGDGDLMAGFAEVCAMPLAEAWKLAGDHPVSCTDCHDPKTMELRVTRPGFMNGIRELKRHQGVKDYDVNRTASHQEMRTFVCAQCHVEYYFKGKEKLLTYPWHEGIKVEEIESYYDKVGHVDWTHAESGAQVLKAQHPEFETYSQGVHARSGVACADCHMPYKREGAAKVTDHHVRSPLLNVRNACLQCHHFSEEEMISRVQTIQDRTRALMDRAETAVVALIDDIVAAKKNGASDEVLKEARSLQRKAQWRLDFVSAENSMGFHAPQETARILAEAVDFARQGQLSARAAAVGISGTTEAPAKK